MALCLLLPCLGMAQEKLINPARLAQDHLSRGDTIRFELRDGPTAKVPVELMLVRAGAVVRLDDAEYVPAASQGVGVVAARIKSDIALGTYGVRAVVDGRSYAASGALTVEPAGGGIPVLAPFDPAETYAVEPFWDAGGLTGGKASELPTVRLLLRGRGFVEASPEDNAIWINGVRQKIVWDKACSDTEAAGTANSPRPHAIHGEVRSQDEIQLCFIPVPAGGRFLVAAGFGDTMSKEQAFRVFSMAKTPVALVAFAIAALMALLPLLLLRFVQKAYRIGGEHYRFRMLFLDPETDTYSLSKFQFYLWTVAAIFGYAYLFISRVHVQAGGWPDVPITLPGIIVVSAGTAIGAQIVTATRGTKGAGAESPSLADFITSGGVVAPDRLQMFLWTIVGVTAFFYAVLQKDPGAITELPAVPERLLVLMGISSAGYLGGKMARKAGPVINELAVTPPEPDDAIRDQAAPAVILPDLVEPIVRAKAALGKLSPGNNADANAAIASLKKAADGTAATHTAAECNQLLVELGNLRDAAEASAVRAAAAFLAEKATAAEAEAAQSAAAALQELTAGITEAISAAAAQPLAMEETHPLIARTIEVRGTNLSPDATIEIDSADLPFPMLLNSEGMNAPEVVARDEVNPTFARVLRYHIDPARLPAVYSEQVRRWFGKGGQHTFTLLNPDAQRAELTFTVPPGAAQKVGTSS